VFELGELALQFDVGQSGDLDHEKLVDGGSKRAHRCDATEPSFTLP
jgi:hypothetical protein